MKVPSNKYQKYFLLVIMLFVLMIAVSVPLDLDAQEKKPTSRSIDSLSYALYTQQQWDELIDAGKLALSHNIDYYYLRMRLGIAWYEKQNYRQAIPHFEQALKFNKNDQTALEYLYYSYLMSGRQADVRRIKPKLSKSTSEKMGIKPRGILEEVYVEGGPGIPSKVNNNENGNHQPPKDSIYSQTYDFDTYAYFHVGAKFFISPNISTYQGYSFLSAPFTQKVRYQKQPLEDYSFTTQQNEYYGNLVITLPHGIQVVPAYHFIWYKYQNRQFHYDTIAFRLVADTLAKGVNDYVLSLAVKKDFPVFSLELNGTYGDFGDATYGQLGLSGWTYPFGNLNFYTQTSFINKWRAEEYDLVFYQMLGGKVVKSLWLEGSFAIGDLTNFAENNAFIIYNSPEKINFKFESVLIYSLNEHLEFSLRYRMVQRESEILYYYTTRDFDVMTTPYLFHSVIGSIKWQL